MIKIRKAKESDLQAIFELHVSSIKSLCSPYYPKTIIKQWIESRNSEIYKNISEFEDEVLIVGENKKEIVGFGLLNLSKKHIIALFVSPKYVNKNFGKKLLNNIEKIARSHLIEELCVFSTLNAAGFYHKMGYKGNIKILNTLQSGIQLESIQMSKNLLNSANEI